MFLTPDPLFSNGVIPIDSVGGAGENWFWCGLNREQVSLAPNGEVILVCSIPESIRYFAVWLSDSHGAAPRSAAKWPLRISEEIFEQRVTKWNELINKLHAVVLNTLIVKQFGG